MKIIINHLCFDNNLLTPLFSAAHRGVFCQFPFRWIYYYGSNKSTGKETGKTHLCAVGYKVDFCLTYFLPMCTLLRSNTKYSTFPIKSDVFKNSSEQFIHTDKDILDDSYLLVSNTFPGFPALGEQNC